MSISEDSYKDGQTYGYHSEKTFYNHQKRSASYRWG